MAVYPRSGSLIDPDRTGTHTGLSTNILIKVGETYVGAVQELTINTTRRVERVKEVGFDGFLEVVPNQPTEVTVSVQRIYFDRLRLPEAFSRAFKNIHQQRMPFNIDVFNMIGAEDPSENANGVEIMTLHNCWFNSYNIPISAGNYIITERADITAEFISSTAPDGGARGVQYVTDDAGVELLARDRRGSLDVEGLIRVAVGGAIRPDQY